MIRETSTMHGTDNRRRYLVHLTCMNDGESNSHRYTVLIQAWPVRRGKQAASYTQVFSDETELVAAMNPLLPRGSDIRDILGHIECKDGFFYLLYLTNQEARSLGWGE